MSAWLADHAAVVARGSTPFCSNATAPVADVHCPGDPQERVGDFPSPAGVVLAALRKEAARYPWWRGGGVTCGVGVITGVVTGRTSGGARPVSRVPASRQLRGDGNPSFTSQVTPRVLLGMRDAVATSLYAASRVTQSLIDAKPTHGLGLQTCVNAVLGEWEACVSAYKHCSRWNGTFPSAWLR